MHVALPDTIGFLFKLIKYLTTKRLVQEASRVAQAQAAVTQN